MVPYYRFSQRMIIAAAIAFLAWKVPFRHLIGPKHSMVISRQAWLDDSKGHAVGLERLPNGGFLIVGNFATGWVVATDTQGALIWKYSAPLDENIHPWTRSITQLKFQGAVTLPDGNILVCGYKSTAPARIAPYITILSSTGTLLEQRELPADGNDDETAAQVDLCVPWNGGMAVSGTTATKASINRTRWIMRLDNKGRNRWQKPIPPGSNLLQLMETADHNLLVATRTDTEIALQKWTDQGDVAAHGAPFQGNSAFLLPTIQPVSEISLVDYFGGSRSYQVKTFSAALEPLGQSNTLPAISIPGFTAEFGLLGPSHSAVYFGYINDGSSAAIQWISNVGDGLGAVTLSRGVYGSPYAAVPLASNQFLVLASQNGYALRHQGLILSWVTLE